MQAEKKELVTNDLAKSLGRAYDTVKQGPSRNTVVFFAAALALVLIGVLFYWFWTSSSSTESQRWFSLDEAVFSEQLNTLLENKELKDTPQHRIAQFKEARMKLSQGLRDLGNPNESTRKAAREKIEAGVAIYDTLAPKSTSLSPQLHQEALWGAAKGKEALGGKANVDEAVKLYERLVKEYPASALGKDAAKQLERLDSTSTQKDLADLSKEFGTR